MKHGETDNLREELLSFIRAVKGEQPVEVTGKEGRDALAVAIEINEAIAEQLERNGS
jgi:hypothetical protein